CRCDDLRLIKQDSVSGRTRSQNQLQQWALAATDIDNISKSAEVISFKYRLGFRSGVARHRSIENRVLVGVMPAISPGIHPTGKLLRTFSGFDAVKQIAPGAPLSRRPDPSRVVACRTSCIAGQAGAQSR